MKEFIFSFYVKLKLKTKPISVIFCTKIYLKIKWKKKLFLFGRIGGGIIFCMWIKKSQKSIKNNEQDKTFRYEAHFSLDKKYNSSDKLIGSI